MLNPPSIPFSRTDQGLYPSATTSSLESGRGASGLFPLPGLAGNDPIHRVAQNNVHAKVSQRAERKIVWVARVEMEDGSVTMAEIGGKTVSGTVSRLTSFSATASFQKRKVYLTPFSP